MIFGGDITKDKHAKVKTRKKRCYVIEVQGKIAQEMLRRAGFEPVLSESEKIMYRSIGCLTRIS